MSFLFAFVYFFLFTIYSFRGIYLKKRFLLKELTIALGPTLGGLVGMYAAIGTFSPETFVATLVLGLYVFIIQPAVNDSLDMKEDRLSGIQSLAVRMDWSGKTRLLFIGALSPIVFVPLVYMYFDFSVLLPAIAVPAALLYAVFLLFS